MMGSNDNNGGGGGPCGACKFLRRKCLKNCVFAPYFDSDQGVTQFAAVHKVFGASNASKLLLRVPPHRRPDAVVSLCYEALSRVRDPVYGCMTTIFTLQQQVDNLQTKLSYVRAQISVLQHFHDHHQPIVHQSSIDNVVDVFSWWPPAVPVCGSTISAAVNPSKTKQTWVAEDMISRGEEEEEMSELEMLASEFFANYVPRVDDDDHDE